MFHLLSSFFLDNFSSAFFFVCDHYHLSNLVFLWIIISILNKSNIWFKSFDLLGVDSSHIQLTPLMMLCVWYLPKYIESNVNAPTFWVSLGSFIMTMILLEPVKVSSKNSKVAFECSPNMLCLTLSLNIFQLSVIVIMSLSMIRRLCLVTLLWRCNITYELWSWMSTFSNSLKFCAWKCSGILTDFFASLFSALGFEYHLDCNDTSFQTSVI